METLSDLNVEFELGGTNYRLCQKTVNSSELTNMKSVALTILISEFNKDGYFQPEKARDFIVKNGLEDLFTETPLTCFKEGNYERPEILSTDEWLENLSSLKRFTILYSNGNEDCNVLRILRCNNSGVDYKVTETGYINKNRLVYRIERVDNFFQYSEHTLLSQNSIIHLRYFDVVLKGGGIVCCRITKRVFELYEKDFNKYGFKFLGFYESLNPLEMVEMVKKDK